MTVRLNHGGALWFGFAAAVLATGGCALLSKSEIVEVRYFSPEHTSLEPTEARPRLTPTKAVSEAPVEVRLGRVSSGAHLRERIAYRNAAFELGYYEDLRWVERPETYVRRDLSRSLFEVHGFRRVLKGAAPTLDVEVTVFDDLRLTGARAARIQLKLLLYEDSGVIFEDTLTIDRPVAGENPKIEDVVAAMAGALDAAAEQVALKLEKALTARRSSSPTTPAR